MKGLAWRESFGDRKPEHKLNNCSLTDTEYFVGKSVSNLHFSGPIGSQMFCVCFLRNRIFLLMGFL
jgi:hypothetical protein